mmetsp:Transcript_75286/g.201057  ORF Transcript_75286/g.201057 Transcript_75286/m.201057 type:complete len:587 (-) Transcript_75286:1069-2829(-)
MARVLDRSISSKGYGPVPSKDIESQLPAAVARQIPPVLRECLTPGNRHLGSVWVALLYSTFLYIGVLSRLWDSLVTGGEGLFALFAEQLPACLLLTMSFPPFVYLFIARNASGKISGLLKAQQAEIQAEYDKRTRQRDDLNDRLRREFSEFSMANQTEFEHARVEAKTQFVGFAGAWSHSTAGSDYAKSGPEDWCRALQFLNGNEKTIEVVLHVLEAAARWYALLSFAFRDSGDLSRAEDLAPCAACSGLHSEVCPPQQCREWMAQQCKECRKRNGEKCTECQNHDPQGQVAEALSSPEPSQLCKACFGHHPSPSGDPENIQNLLDRRLDRAVRDLDKMQKAFEQPPRAAQHVAWLEEIPGGKGTRLHCRAHHLQKGDKVDISAMESQDQQESKKSQSIKTVEVLSVADVHFDVDTAITDLSFCSGALFFRRDRSEPILAVPPKSSGSESPRSAGEGRDQDSSAQFWKYDALRAGELYVDDDVMASESGDAEWRVANVGQEWFVLKGRQSPPKNKKNRPVEVAGTSKEQYQSGAPRHAFFSILSHADSGSARDDDLADGIVEAPGAPFWAFSVDGYCSWSFALLDF